MIPLKREFRNVISVQEHDMAFTKKTRQSTQLSKVDLRFICPVFLNWAPPRRGARARSETVTIAFSPVQVPSVASLYSPLVSSGSTYSCRLRLRSVSDGAPQPTILGVLAPLIAIFLRLPVGFRSTLSRLYHTPANAGCFKDTPALHT